jgi:uncharacterized protein
MIEREEIVAAVVEAAGGQLIGRVRLEKMVYLLDRLGLNSGFEFDYHHYGPFSRDLENATADAKAFSKIEEELDRRHSDGATYSKFKLNPGVEPNPEAYGKLSADRVRELAKLFAKTNVTVLELAATVDWLYRFEHCRDWKAEIRKRKGLKVQGRRLDKALELLEKLGLAPSSLPIEA